MQFMQVLVTGGLVLSVVGAMAQGEVSATEAKRRADRSESTLTAQQMQELVAAQARMLESVFPACVSRFGTPREPFAAVVEIGASGKAVKSWLVGTSPVGGCIREGMAKALIYAPPSTPFYTSFDYTPK